MTGLFGDEWSATFLKSVEGFGPLKYSKNITERSTIGYGKNIAVTWFRGFANLNKIQDNYGNGWVDSDLTRENKLENRSNIKFCVDPYISRQHAGVYFVCMYFIKC